jgi:hypothetical protein
VAFSLNSHSGESDLALNEKKKIAKRERDAAYKARPLSSAASSVIMNDEECDIEYTGIDYDAEDTYAKIQALFEQHEPHKP